jgi:phospholipase/carboxylesterase
MSELVFVERAADGDPEGLVVLHHGRGSHEGDLIGLADFFDPDRRLHFVAPRAPMELAGSPGYHWYLVPAVGRPDPETFAAAFSALAEFHDLLWERTGLTPAQTILGGFSMGSVMSFSLGLAGDRPVPAGLLCFSGFIPAVESWSPSFEDRSNLPVFIAHGTGDPVISVEFARSANIKLESAGLPTEYHEFPGGHTIDPSTIEPAAAFIAQSLAP